MSASASRVLIACALAGVVVAGVSACATETEATGPTPTASAEAPSATPTPTATEAPAAPVGTPVTITCDELISLQAMFDFNPNYALSESYKPAAGGDAAAIVADKGLACAWVQQTSGEIIEVAVANLPAEELTHLKNDFVTNSMSVPTYGDPTVVEGYFMPGTVGQADVFSGPYWLSIDSDAFLEPGDALPVVEAALTGLGQ